MEGEGEDGGSAHRAPWTPAAASALLASVRQALLQPGPRPVPWDHVFERLRGALPGRTLRAMQLKYRYRSRPRALAEGAEEGEDEAEDEDAAGAARTQWSQAECAALAAAVQAGLARAELSVINWAYVEGLGAPGLAGRSRHALEKYWRRFLSQTPAAQAMLREVGEELAAGAPGPLPPPPPTPSSSSSSAPFRMLHSLRSAGAIDEATLRVCWRAAAEAMR
jgi:hypothetical protein